MKTAEEIINKYVFHDSLNELVYKEDALFAMEMYASEQCQKRDELIRAQDEYIKLLTDELDEVVGMMAAHGWKSHRYEQGKQAREKIEQLKSEL